MAMDMAHDKATRMSMFLLLFAALANAQTQPAPTTFPVDSITIEGNRILGTAAIVRASGLKTGAPGDSAAFDAARDRLLGSGYFETVAYRYKPAQTPDKKSGGYDVTFEVRETEALFPIRVEALGVSTDEAVAYLKSKDPLFNGRMPGTKPALDRTAREIEQLLSTKQEVGARVVATAPEHFEIEFTPLRGLPAVASVAFEGSKAIGATELRNKIAEVAFGQVFTEAGFRVFLENQIRPLYEAKGYMRVAFPKITTEPSALVKGLDVKVVIDEGQQYKLSKVTVRGPEDDSARILKIAKIPPMTIADFDQIRDGAARVKDALRHDGYLDADASYDRKPDDAGKTVEAILAVEQGPRYTFGKLTVNGLGLDGEAAIRKMWSVKPGDPFPQDYASYFASQVKQEGLFDNLSDVKATPDINRKTHVVDVTLDFKSAPQAPKPPRRPGGLP
jgi:outer membrane protein assembly factor BamA